jgi:hypothetical protein
MIDQDLERVVCVVQTFCSGSTVVVTVPRATGIKKGVRFEVKIDSRGRLVYEPLPPIQQEDER